MNRHLLRQLAAALLMVGCASGTSAQTAPEDSGEYVCGTIGVSEIIIEGWVGEVRLRGAQGEVLHAPFSVEGRQGGCDIYVNTNTGFGPPVILDGCGFQQGSALCLIVNPSNVVVFEFGETALNGEWETAHSFTYGGVSSARNPAGCPYDPGSFYCPNTLGNVSSYYDLFVFIDDPNHDGMGRVRYMPDDLGSLCAGGQPKESGVCLAGSGLSAALYIDEFLGSGTWVMPYEMGQICDAAPGLPGCGTARHAPAPFVYPGSNPNPSLNPVYRFSGVGDVVRPGAVGSTSATVSNWTTPGLRLEFPAGQRLVVGGTLNASGVTFTAANPAVGWGGVRFEANSGGAWTGAFVERVAGPGLPEPGQPRVLPTHAVRVTDASPTFTGVTVRLPASGTGPVDGFYVSETATPQNTVVITDPTIQQMGGSGVVANAAARVEVVGGDVTLSGGPAVKVGGAGSVVYLAPAVPRTPGTQIFSNPGGGVLAASGGAVRFSQPAGGDGFATIRDNPGRGLVASGAGVVYAGTATQSRKNRIFSNGSGGSAGNARASGTSSRVYARCAWWNQETFPYRTTGVSGGLVDVTGALAEDPYSNPNAPCPDGSTIDGRPGGGASIALRGGATAVGRDGVTALDRLAEALGAATAAEAVTLLAALVADEPAAPESAAALAEAGGIAGQAGAPLSAVALLDGATTSAYGALRVAAWQGLVASRQAQGDRAGALAAADALAGEGASALVQAELARVYLHAAAADSAAAWASLSSLEALAPASVELGLARSFLGLGGEPEDEGRGAGAAAETASVGVQVSDGTGEAVTLAVGPNPAAASASVMLTLAAAGEASVVVYDLLGRAVVTLLSGSHAAGTHRVALDTSRLAPGVYVVRASASAAAGPLVRTARLTVVR